MRRRRCLDEIFPPPLRKGCNISTGDGDDKEEWEVDVDATFEYNLSSSGNLLEPNVATETAAVASKNDAGDEFG